MTSISGRSEWVHDDERWPLIHVELHAVSIAVAGRVSDAPSIFLVANELDSRR